MFNPAKPFMPRNSLFYLGGGLTLMALSFTTFQIFRYERPPSPVRGLTQSVGNAAAEAKTPVIAPDLKALASRMDLSGAALPSAASIAEDRRVVGEQVASALTWLESVEVKRRIEGAEQLGAYPTADAERALIAHLRNDPSPEVRIAAANSLGFFNAPSEAATLALVRALEDHHADVSAAALSTVEIVLKAAEADPVRARQLHKYIRQAARSRKMDPEILEQVQSLLNNP